MPADETKLVSGTATPASEHLDNPFVGATFYRNVDYTAAVNAAADRQSGSLGAANAACGGVSDLCVAGQHRGSAWHGAYERSLAGHLDAALAQGANAIGIVIYDMPNRDGSALASNGELLIAENGLHRYKTNTSTRFSKRSTSRSMPRCAS